MKIQMAMATIGVLALAGQNPCTKAEPHSAKDDLKGKVLFNEGSFEDAKKFTTGAEFTAKENVKTTFTPAAPQSHIGYYSALPEPLGSSEYLLEIFDRTEGNGAPVHVERGTGTPTTSQVTAGWTFDIPTWPPPQDPEKLLTNDVWIKPGHHYEVVIMKPLSRGEFSVGGEIQAAAPAPTPAPAKGKAAKEDPVEHSPKPVKKGAGGGAKKK